MLVTGSSGFIGRHLTVFLRKEGARVLGVSRHPQDEDIERKIDISVQKEVSDLFQEFKPDVCFHLASEALVEHGSHEPYETFRNNILGAVNILEAARNNRISRIVVASTSHVYGKAPLPYHEDDPARPSRPYETSKTCVDLIAQSYADSFNVPVLIPRFVNIYGPGDLNYSRIIPKTMRSVILGKNPVMWGGSAKREYMYIDDAISAYSKLGKITDEQLEKNRIYNVGSGVSISARDIVNKIILLSGKKLRIKRIQEGREEELPEQVVSSDKIRRVMRWKPQVNINEGLRITYEWYKRSMS